MVEARRKLSIKRRQLLYVLLLVNTLVYAQKTTRYTGVVIDAHSDRPLDGATLRVNGKTKWINQLAMFSVQLHLNDTIVFSHADYHPLELVLTDTQMIADLPRIVKLQTTDIVLHEFTVRPHIVTKEMMANASYHIKVLKQELLEDDYNSACRSYAASGAGGSGISSSQMVGLNVTEAIKMVKKWTGKDTSSKEKDKPIKRMSTVVCYEEYLSSMKSSSEHDTAGNIN